MSKKFFVRQLLFIFIFFYWHQGSIKYPFQTKAYTKGFFNKCPGYLISHLHNIHILKICRKFTYYEKSGNSLTLPWNKQTKFNTTFWKTEQWSRPSKRMILVGTAAVLDHFFGLKLLLNIRQRWPSLLSRCWFTISH